MQGAVSVPAGEIQELHRVPHSPTRGGHGSSCRPWSRGERA